MPTDTAGSPLLPNATGHIHADALLRLWLGRLRGFALVGVTNEGQLTLLGTGSLVDSRALLERGSEIAGALVTEGALAGLGCDRDTDLLLGGRGP